MKIKSDSTEVLATEKLLDMLYFRILFLFSKAYASFSSTSSGLSLSVVPDLRGMICIYITWIFQE